MIEIKVLIEGYAKQIEGGWNASSTVTLVKYGNLKIIIDPGCSRGKLSAALVKEKLKVEDIDFVLLTHSHLDHILLTGIFQSAKIITTEEIYKDDEQVSHENIIPNTDLKIIQTPGHCAEHCSLVVPTENGIYAVAGDVFWYTDSEEQTIDITKPDLAHPLEVDMEKLMESRKKILNVANWVIPGHGKMFKVK